MGSSRIPPKTGCRPKLLDIRHCGFWWLHFWYFLHTKWSEAWVLWLLPLLVADDVASIYYTLWGWATKTHQSLQRWLQGLRSSYQRLGQDVTSPPDIKIFDQQLEVVHDLIDLRSSIRQTVSHSIVSWTREWAIQYALYSFQGYSRHLFSLAYSSEKCSTQRSICCAPPWITSSIAGSIASLCRLDNSLFNALDSGFQLMNSGFLVSKTCIPDSNC